MPCGLHQYNLDFLWNPVVRHFLSTPHPNILVSLDRVLPFAQMWEDRQAAEYNWVSPINIAESSIHVAVTKKAQMIKSRDPAT
jgi:hypothetical protein